MMFSLWIALLSGSPAMGDPPPAGQQPAARPFGFDATPRAGNCGVPAVEPGKPVPERLLLAARDTPNLVRILLSTDRTTMDFRPDRLTIIIDGNGVVLSTRCG
jgi:hypothetical protein